ncbi:MAG: HEAT repeat domain-containing protein [Planctomycetes bacterium]|nr:HEAT repeat domain-containing protein [Planctomycetota bacterium]
MLTLALALSLVLQDPEPARPQDPPAGPPPVAQEPAPPVVEEWDDRRARDVLRELQDRLKGRDVPLKERVAAVELLATGCNKRLVKPLAELVLRESSVIVRKRAAELLGNQPPKDAKRVIVQLLQNRDLDDMPAVLAALVDSLSRAGYESRDWEVLDGMFEREYSPERTGLQQAILRLIATHKEIQAIDLLLDNLGQPVPEDVDSPANPPAEYWEARWKAWEVWRLDVKAALFEITGQRFNTPQEAREWLKKNGRSIGIR